MSVVNVTFYKLYGDYYIEIVKFNEGNRPLVWKSKNINDGYSFLVKELLVMNKDVSSINFLYKVRQTSFLRLHTMKKDIVPKLKEYYQDDLEKIEYLKKEIKDVSKEYHQLIWCVNKIEKDKILSFFNSLSIKKKNLMLLDYYYYNKFKDAKNELIAIVGFSKITCLYFDEISLSDVTSYEIDSFDNVINNNTKDNYMNYLEEIMFLINYSLRVHSSLDIKRVVLIVNNNFIRLDLNYLLYKIDHKSVVVKDEV